MPDAKHAIPRNGQPYPGPWHIYGNRDSGKAWIEEAVTPERLVVCDLPGDLEMLGDEERANTRLLAASPDFLAACTRERDTVSALDWLAAVLTVVDGRFGALAGDDPQALYTALQASTALLAELRAAVARVERGNDE